MAEKGREPEIVAVENVHRALKPLDADARKRVLSSVFALLQIDVSPTEAPAPARRAEVDRSPGSPPQPPSSRPVSVIELMQQKQPGTDAQRIALFAYYREKHEGLQRFDRDALAGYFAKAKLRPPAIYARSFAEAVRKGWIHEDGADSYLTSKGVEAAESGFTGERKYATRPGPRTGSRRHGAVKRGRRRRPKVKP